MAEMSHQVAQEFLMVYVTVDNSDNDNRLTQQDWSALCAEVGEAVRVHAHTVHAAWYTVASDPRQSACWGLEATAGAMARLRERLAVLAREYCQDAIVWALASAELIGPG